MAKIIAFPRNPCYTPQRSRHGKLNQAVLAGEPVPGTPGAQHAGHIQPIWKSRTQGILMSVVLPARGRPGLLNRCLAALMRQSLSPLRYEIIVVDTAPSSASRKVVEHWMTRPGNGPCIIYLPVEAQDSPGAARNHGWHIARGTLIAFTEEDMMPCRDWLAQGLQAFDGIVQAVRGRTVMPMPGLPSAHECEANQLAHAGFVSANGFFLRRVLEELGGFDERFGAPGGDDADLYFRLLQSEAVIADAPQAVVEQPADAHPWGASLLEQKNRQFDALLYKKHPRLYREKIAPALPWHYHVIVAALLVLAAALAYHQTLAAMLAAAGWLLLSAHLCLLRLRGTAKSAPDIAETLLTSLLLPPLAVFWRLVGALRFRVGFI